MSGRGNHSATTSDARLRAEQRARAEAEAMLAQRTEQLQKANRKLILESEALRDALARTEAMRTREARTRRGLTILSRAMAALSGNDSAAGALQALLDVLQHEFGVTDAFFVQCCPEGLVIAASARPRMTGRVLPAAPDLVQRPRRMAGLPVQPAPKTGDPGEGTGDGPGDAPGNWAAHGSVILAPLIVPSEPAGALMLGCDQTGRFSAADLQLLQRVAELAAQALLALREARRNALLVSLIEGNPPETGGGVLDAPLEAIHRAFGRMTDMQGAVVSVLDALLAAPLSHADDAIEAALGRMGKITGTDRVYVFRLRPDGDYVDNTHEWCAPGIAPARHLLQGIPAHMMAHWLAEFEQDQELTIADVAALPEDRVEKPVLLEQGIQSLLVVPMFSDGVFAGFVGYDSVHALRSFLRSEVHLIRSVAKVISAVLARRDAEARLRAAHDHAAAERSRLDSVLSAMPDLVVELDREGRFVDWHSGAIPVPDAVVQAFGGKLLEEALPPELAVQARQVLALIDAGQRAEVPRFELDLTGEGLRWWQLSASAMGDHGYLFVLRDVSERHAQAQALRIAADETARARAMLEAAVEAMNDGFVLYDADDRLVICNSRYREIYPRAVPALVPGTRFEDVMRYALARGSIFEAVGREEAWLAERLERHRQPYSEIEQQQPDGRWLRIYKKETPDGGRVGLRVDITALKTAEQRAIEDRSAALEASHDGIAIIDATERFSYVNPAFIEMFAHDDAAALIGQHWSILNDPDDQGWERAEAERELLARGRWSGELRARTRIGRPVDLDLSMTMQPDGGVLCIARDMTDRRREAAERERLREQLVLAQRREVVGQLAAGLAHDFNNLLAAIAGSAELIGVEAKPGSALAAGVGRIGSAADQAAGLVRRLLTLGARRRDRRELDMRAPLREAAELLRASMGGDIRLRLLLPETEQTAIADPTDVLQVVLNLAINARDALADKGGEITIALAEAQPADLLGPFEVGTLDLSRRYLCMSVTDTGPGVDADLISQIFKPYQSTKGDQGIGLGLSIVASVVQANGGAIRLQTAPGAGARFCILWPLGSAEAPGDIAPAPGLSGSLDGRAILVVDDRQEVLDVITAMLEAAGAEVAPTTEPAEICAAVRSDPGAWDLLITDYDMSGMNGAELARAVRAHAPLLPVILVTALAGVAGRTGALFDAVLPKPVGRHALAQAAQKAISQGRTEKGK